MRRVEVRLDSVRRASHTEEWLLLLKEQHGKRYLPIYVGPIQASAITRIMADKYSPEYDDLYGLPGPSKVASLSASDSVTITKTEDNILYAELPNQEIEISVYVALAIGLKARARICADESILEKGGDTTTWFEKRRIQGR